MPATNWPGHPQVRRGPRAKLDSSAAGRANLRRVASELGLTQRIVLDALLEDYEIVRAYGEGAARNLRARMGGGANGE